MTVAEMLEMLSDVPVSWRQTGIYSDSGLYSAQDPHQGSFITA